MVRALFRQLVLLVASLISSAALMAVVVTVDGSARGVGVRELLSGAAPVRVAQVSAPVPARAAAPCASSGCKSADTSPF
mgnify:CR=1 FL=1